MSPDPHAPCLVRGMLLATCRDFLYAGHFPWLLTLFNPLLAYTEGGKALKYVVKTAKDLIKIRKETGQTGKVATYNVSDGV